MSPIILLEDSINTNRKMQKFSLKWYKVVYEDAQRPLSPTLQKNEVGDQMAEKVNGELVSKLEMGMDD